MVEIIVDCLTIPQNSHALSGVSLDKALVPSWDIQLLPVNFKENKLPRNHSEHGECIPCNNVISNIYVVNARHLLVAVVVSF